MAGMNLRYGQFYGETVNVRNVRAFSLSETVYPPNLRVPKHSHEHAYFCFVRRGAFSERFETRTRFCTVSTLVFHPAEETPSDSFHDFGGQCFNIQVNSSWLKLAHEYGLASDVPVEFSRGELSTLVTRLYREFRQADSASSLLMEGLILEIIGHTARHSLRLCGKEPPRWLEEAREIIQQVFPSLSRSLKSQKLSTSIRYIWRVRSGSTMVARSANTFSGSEQSLPVANSST